MEEVKKKIHVANSGLTQTGLRRSQMHTPKKTVHSKLLSSSGTYSTLGTFATWINPIGMMGVRCASDSTAWDSASQTASSKMATAVLMHPKSKGLRPLLMELGQTGPAITKTAMVMVLIL